MLSLSGRVSGYTSLGLLFKGKILGVSHNRFAKYSHVWPSDTPFTLFCEIFCVNCWHPYSCDFSFRDVHSPRTCILGPEGFASNRDNFPSPGLPWYVAFVRMVV